MTAFLPTKCRLRKCTINGVDMRLQCQNIKVYESMCTPYIKMQMTIVDNNGALLGIAEASGGTLAGKPVSVAFDAGENVYERDEQLIFTVDSHPSEQNKRVQVYNIGTVGQSYIKDRSALVQKTFKNTPASSAAATVHSMFLGGDAPLKQLNSSLGMIAKDTIGSFPISNVKPFKAIEDLLYRAKYASAANPTVYFRDAQSYVMGPLQDVFAQTSANYEFIEKATWGIHIDDMFNAHNAVIAASLLVEEDDIRNSRSSIGSSAAAAKQSLNVFNIGKNIIDIDKAASDTGLSGLVNIAAGFSNKAGGSMNSMLFNSLRNELSTDPSISRVAEQEFLAKVKDADKYLVKVPIRGGLKCTVGQGVNARLLGPAGDQNARQIGGLMLVADMMHDCFFDKRTVMGTSTFRGVRVGDV